MHIDFSTLTPYQRYKLMASLIVPRPIALVTTLSDTGVVNAAPFSMFNMVGEDPPLVMLSVNHHNSQGRLKDTAANILSRREFVVHLCDEAVAEAMHRCATEAPADVSELDLTGCRRSACDELEAPALQPLPATRYVIGRCKGVKVNIDYHVEFEGDYNSVPHRLVGTRLDVRATDTLVVCFAANQRVVCHPLSLRRGAHTTLGEHMLASHRAHLEWTPSKRIVWAQGIGVSAAAVVSWQIEKRPHPEQGYRACLGLMRLAREYTSQRQEDACTRALAIRAPTYRSVDNILKNGLDSQPSHLLVTSSPLLDHENVRGTDYYH
ncbi:hypothetical protein EYS42_15565 [Aquabacterium lacunae]|uniref:Flavin reductase like domain-containing protein n=1 Tax=Aquabacterium lacunae TaxID=2528630 RepID=A0A4Q9GWA1_9BURK|nr:hypothetical protein EYS42_15565 [Aquabacterium lacunae]